LRAKTPQDRKLLDLIDPVAEAVGYDIVRLRLMGGDASGRTLQIMAERPSDGDMEIDDCSKLSRAISEVLDALDPVEGEYRLEVSSPGVDRPLTRLKDFEAYEGYEAKLELDRLAENRKRFRGKLGGVEEVEGAPHVAIDLDGEEETALVPFAWIIDAKLILNDDLMKLGAQRRAQRIENEPSEVEDEDSTDEEEHH
jgi:ribosome maturation factor RimP